jgi:hypothetical protein
MYVYIYIYSYILCINMYVCIYVFIYIYIYIYMYMNTFIYVYIYIYLLLISSSNRSTIEHSTWKIINVYMYIISVYTRISMFINTLPSFNILQQSLNDCAFHMEDRNSFRVILYISCLSTGRTSPSP